MKGDMQNHMDPPTAPPPYPGPPAGSSYPGDIRGQSNPNNFNHPPPLSSQPRVTVVYPNNPMATVHTNTIIVTNNMGPNPTVYVCPSCNQQTITMVVRSPSLRTHMFALLLCICGCWPCACVPYCVDSCNNAEHYCTNCKAYLGSYIG